MFTGIVEEQGTVVSLRRGQDDARLTIQGSTQMKDLGVGESIAVDGVCLTVVEPNEATFATDLSVETLQRTTLGALRSHDRVNLERSLQVGDRLGGHFVTGHVDGVGRIVRVDASGTSKWMWIRFPEPLGVYIAPKGSIAVDGVSLTIVDVSQEAFSVCLIPHTLVMTTLGQKGSDSFVNLEVDLLSRYLHRLLAEQTPKGRSPLPRELLHEQGFA